MDKIHYAACKDDGERLFILDPMILVGTQCDSPSSMTVLLSWVHVENAFYSLSHRSLHSVQESQSRMSEIMNYIITKF